MGIAFAQKKPNEAWKQGFSGKGPLQSYVGLQISFKYLAHLTR